MVTENSVGIDYHEKYLQVCIISPSGEMLLNKQIKNSVKTAVDAVSRYGESACVVAEACNGSASFLDDLRKVTGWQTKLCHPGYAQRMRHNPDKTDKSDGELIADLNRVGYLPEVWLAPPEVRDLRTLVRYRFEQVREMKETKVKVRALLRHNRIKPPEEHGLWTKKGYLWLKENAQLQLREHSAWVLSRFLHKLLAILEEIKVTEKLIRKYVEKDTLCKRLMEQKGIGFISAAVMRAEIGDFNRFKTGKQLSRFCGVTPRNVSSGEKIADSGLIRAGNPLLKTCIIQGALSLIRYEKTWGEFATNLLNRGKPKGVVVAAVANRWTRRLFHQFRQQELVQ